MPRLATRQSFKMTERLDWKASRSSAGCSACSGIKISILRGGRFGSSVLGVAKKRVPSSALPSIRQLSSEEHVGSAQSTRFLGLRAESSQEANFSEISTTVMGGCSAKVGNPTLWIAPRFMSTITLGGMVLIKYCEDLFQSSS